VHEIIKLFASRKDLSFAQPNMSLSRIIESKVSSSFHYLFSLGGAIKTSSALPVPKLFMFILFAEIFQKNKSDGVTALERRLGSNKI
jgi:hypothetical protein